MLGRVGFNVIIIQQIVRPEAKVERFVAGAAMCRYLLAVLNYFKNITAAGF